MGKCSICGKEVDSSRMGQTSHARKHKNQFAEETGLSKRMNYEIVKAYFHSDDAAAWANQIVRILRENDCFQQTSLDEVTGEKDLYKVWGDYHVLVEADDDTEAEDIVHEATQSLMDVSVDAGHVSIKPPVLEKKRDRR